MEKKIQKDLCGILTIISIGNVTFENNICTLNYGRQVGEDSSRAFCIASLYGINFGGGGSRSGVTHTELWNYSVENAGTIKYGTTQDYTLRDNINNYDFILIENMSHSSDDTNTSWQATNHFIFSVEELNSNKYNNYINFTSYDMRSSRFYIKDTTYKCTTANQGSTNGLVRLVGLKIASSIAVDDKLDLESENPVQNKVIAASLNGIDTLLDYILGNEIETSNVYKIFDGVGIGEGGALE